MCLCVKTRQLAILFNFRLNNLISSLYLNIRRGNSSYRWKVVREGLTIICDVEALKSL